MSGHLSLTEKVNAALQQLSREIEANTLQLPSPPDNIITLRKLIQTDANVDVIAAHLRKDPHLSARLVKVANSVLFTGRGHVTDVKSAIVRLGLSKVQNLVTGFAITQQFLRSKTAGIETQLRQSWSKSNQVAGIITVLAREKTRIDADMALLAGQLHNIGETPLLLRINSMTDLGTNPEMKKAVINMVLARLSAKVGAAILKKWHFPPEIVQLPFAESNTANTDTETEINLKNLLLISKELRHCGFTHPLSSLPDSIKQQVIFPLFWVDEDMAINNLNDLAPQIHETQVMLSSS
ncbi:HDOD domain-containing protein [Methylophaga thiooxydans]|uniref:HDOD domain-containing protein n=1 Tax=Methylophaga thiooxydans TaxID=392484 RepID=UPI00235748A1|nr:HDOD domain-containing protein [Methylophaga thiooxydans]